MITLLASVGFATIVFLIWKASSDQQDNNKKLLELAPYSDVCKQYLKSVENSFPPISYEAKQAVQLKLLKDPSIKRQALANFLKEEETRIKYKEQYEKFKKDQEFVWRRDHKLLYATFYSQPVFKASELVHRISQITHNDNLDSIKKRLQHWKRYELVIPTRYTPDTAPADRKSQCAQWSSYLRVNDSIVQGLSKKPMVIREISTGKIHLMDSDGQLHIVSASEVGSSLYSGFYKPMYDGDYLYKMCTGFDYKTLVEDGVIISVEEYNKIIQEYLQQKSSQTREM